MVLPPASSFEGESFGRWSAGSAMISSSVVGKGESGWYWFGGSHHARSPRASYGSHSSATDSTLTLVLVGFSDSVSRTRAVGS